MSKPKHTPGPWKVVYEEIKGDPKHSIYTTENKYIADVPVGFYHGGLKLHLHDTSDHAEANANLIAAAPDLLEACQELINRADEISEETEDYGKLIADSIIKIMEAVKKKWTGIFVGGWRTDFLALILSCLFAAKLYWPAIESTVFAGLFCWLVPAGAHKARNGG